MMVSFWTGTGPCQRSTGSAGRKDFTLQHGYIQRDFDVSAWAAPEFLE
jgi:hypothetical protein